MVMLGAHEVARDVRRQHVVDERLVAAPQVARLLRLHAHALAARVPRALQRLHLAHRPNPSYLFIDCLYNRHCRITPAIPARPPISQFRYYSLLTYLLKISMASTMKNSIIMLRRLWMPALPIWKTFMKCTLIITYILLSTELHLQ